MKSKPAPKLFKAGAETNSFGSATLIESITARMYFLGKKAAEYQLTKLDKKRGALCLEKKEKGENVQKGDKLEGKWKIISGPGCPEIYFSG